jgi:hypothetical protein
MRGWHPRIGLRARSVTRASPWWFCKPRLETAKKSRDEALTSRQRLIYGSGCPERQKGFGPEATRGAFFPGDCPRLPEESYRPAICQWARLLLGTVQTRGSWEDIPEGTPVYARAVHHHETSSYLEGPIEYRAGDEGSLEPFRGGQSASPRVGHRPDPWVAPSGIPIRFPWLVEDRNSRRHEREAAIAWTAEVWAVEQLRTMRRTVSSRRQENAVVSALLKVGFEQHTGIRRLDNLDELPRGQFSREASLAGTKCDIPARLKDGRLLALECKVSNSALNSVKRLNRETGGKARTWRNAFGQPVVAGAVLAGVFKLSNLLDAQEDYEVPIFWEHNLRPLQKFVRDAT